MVNVDFEFFWILLTRQDLVSFLFYDNKGREGWIASINYVFIFIPSFLQGAHSGVHDPFLPPHNRAVRKLELRDSEWPTVRHWAPYLSGNLNPCLPVPNPTHSGWLQCILVLYHSSLSSSLNLCKKSVRLPCGFWSCFHMAAVAPVKYTSSPHRSVPLCSLSLCHCQVLLPIWMKTFLTIHESLIRVIKIYNWKPNTWRYVLGGGWWAGEIMVWIDCIRSAMPMGNWKHVLMQCAVNWVLVF